LKARLLEAWPVSSLTCSWWVRPILSPRGRDPPCFWRSSKHGVPLATLAKAIRQEPARGPSLGAGSGAGSRTSTPVMGCCHGDSACRRPPRASAQAPSPAGPSRWRDHPPAASYLGPIARLVRLAGFSSIGDRRPLFQVLGHLLLRPLIPPPPVVLFRRRDRPFTTPPRLRSLRVAATYRCTAAPPPPEDWSHVARYGERPRPPSQYTSPVPGTDAFNPTSRRGPSSNSPVAMPLFLRRRLAVRGRAIPGSRAIGARAPQAPMSAGSPGMARPNWPRRRRRNEWHRHGRVRAWAPTRCSGLKASVPAPGWCIDWVAGAFAYRRGRATNPPAVRGQPCPVGGRDAKGSEAGRGCEGRIPGPNKNHWRRGIRDATEVAQKPGTAAGDRRWMRNRARRTSRAIGPRYGRGRRNGRATGLAPQGTVPALKPAAGRRQAESP